MQSPSLTPTSTSFWTFDGLLVNVSIYSVAEVPETETFYAAFSVADGSDGPERLKPVGPEPAPAEETEETPVRSAEEIAAEVEEFNAKLSGWIFELAPYSKTNLAKRMADLVQPIVVEEPFLVDEDASAEGAPQDGAPLFEGGLPEGFKLPDGLNIPVVEETEDGR